MSEHLILFILVFPLIGILTGFLSGMLGIGGSIVMVPALYIVLKKVGIASAELMHFAIGTAFSIMVFTSITNAITHIRMGNVLNQIIKRMITFLIIGVIVGSWSIKYIQSDSLKRIFALFLIIISIDLIVRFTRFITKTDKDASLALPLGGLGTGFISGFLGIGGGSTMIPFFLYLGFETKKSIGTSAVLTFPIALSGVIVSVLHMMHIRSDIPMTMGYIYLPALIIISVCCVVSVPFGAKALKHIPQDRAKQIFAVLLFITALKMFLS